MIENIYAPFRLPFHLTFCIIATLFYLLMLKRRGSRHYLFLIVAIDLTIIPQFVPDKNVVFWLGVTEILLLILIFISMISDSIKKKKKRKSKVCKDSSGKNLISDAFSDDI